MPEPVTAEPALVRPDGGDQLSALSAVRIASLRPAL